MKQIILLSIVYVLCSARSCQFVPPKDGDCGKVQHYWLIDTSISTVPYGSPDQVITVNSSLWLRKKADISQEVLIQFKSVDFVSFTSSYFGHEFDVATKTLRILHPGLGITNQKFMHMGDIVFKYKVRDVPPDEQTPMAKISYVANTQGNFSACDFQFEQIAQKQTGYRNHTPDFVMDLNEL